MVRVLLKRSDNHYTEHLYQLLKLKDVKISEFWKEKGIDTKALVILMEVDYLVEIMYQLVS